MPIMFLSMVARRLVGSIPILFVVSIMIFIILRMLPADPLAMLLPPNATAEDAANLKAQYGFDQPLLQQYVTWTSHAISGDLGESIQSRLPVTKLILDALPATIELVIFGLAIGLVLGVGSGLLLYLMRDRPEEFIGELAGIVMLSIPEFLWAIFLLLIFGVTLDFLPFIGRLEAGVTVDTVTGFLLIDALIGHGLDVFWDVLEHMLLPALALGLAFAPLVMRVLQASLLELEYMDYVVMARLRGLSRARVLLNHLLRNAALPTLSLIGVQTAFLFGGTLLIEIIFSYPGLGNLMVEAIRTQDLPLIQGIALTYCAVVLVLNALVDAANVILNPKLRVKQ